AAKLTGKTHGWSLAVLDGVTDHERASYIDASGIRGVASVAPRANYFAARARHEIRAGQTILGAMVTGVHRALGDSVLAARVRSRAFAGGADFTHEWNERTWSLDGFVAGSYIEGTPT